MRMRFVRAGTPPMDPARWKKLKEIVGEAMERPLAGRAAYVASACGGDEALAGEVQSLLAHDAESGHFLDGGAAALFGEGENLVGRELGPWRLTGEAGRGGMGTVYLAERTDGAYRQRVAVKVLRRGMDTEQLLRRFRTENGKSSPPSTTRTSRGCSTAARFQTGCGR